jgi:hypothetical protein
MSEAPEAPTASATPPRITTRDVEAWCAVSQARDGRKIQASVLRPWCAGNAIHAEVQGSGSAPYRIDITFKDGGSKPSAKCTCPAWRSNPLCKHVAAVLLTWASKADSFAVVEVPATEPKAKPARPSKKPDSGESSEGTALAEAPKKSRADAETEKRALIENGLSQATELLGELAAGGLLTVTTQQADGVLKLAELLISQKLTRLGRAMQVLSLRLRQLSAQNSASGNQSSTDNASIAVPLADAWLTLSATKRALQADASNGESAAETAYDLEDLLGTRFDESRLSKFTSEALLEVAFEEETDEIGFVTGTSYLLDLASGEVMLDRKIVPARLAERERKRPYYSLLVNSQLASSRSKPPRRVKVGSIGQQQAITPEAVTRATRHAVTTIAVLRRRLAEQTADPLAEPELLALFAHEAFQVVDLPASGKKAGGQQLLLVDAEGIALPVEGATPSVLGAAVHDPVLALFGRLKLNERGDTLVFAPLSLLCASGKVRMVG